MLNAHTGEVLAMASLPDYDPNDPVDALKPDRLNRMTAGAYELGSVFKSFTFAMALDSGEVKMSDTIDASQPIHVGGFTIHDFHGKHRAADRAGGVHLLLQYRRRAHGDEGRHDGQQAYLKRFGLLDQAADRPAGSGLADPARRWTDLTTMTVAFGQGLAVTPHADGGGRRRAGQWRLAHPADLRAAHRASRPKTLAVRVIKPETSDDLRYLFRLNVVKGSGRQAAVPGYMVGGKTGTAEKVVNGRYSDTQAAQFIPRRLPDRRPAICRAGRA